MDVYYNGSFWDHRQDGTPCRPVPVNREFEWNGYTWKIPSVYVCSQGLVMDISKQVPLTEVKAFVEKWKERNTDDHEAAEYENPLSARFSLDIRTDGAQLCRTRSCGTCWHPFGDERGNPSGEALELMNAYNCSRDYGWHFSRMFFRWDSEKVPRNVRLALTFKPEKYLLPCPEHFAVTADMAEKTVEFTHPVTGSLHSLKICEASREMLSECDFEEKGKFTYPRHCLRLRYRFEDGQEYGRFHPRDCSQGDAPRKNGAAEDGRTLLASSVAAVGIITGADGDAPEARDGREAYSALHFVPVDRSEWRIDACVLAGEEYELSLDIDIL